MVARHQRVQRSLKAQLELDPDVRFSLLLDDDLPLESATATACEPVKGRREFDWMTLSGEGATDSGDRA